MKYDVKLQFASLNGINLTNFGDVFCEHTRDGQQGCHPLGSPRCY